MALNDFGIPYIDTAHGLYDPEHQFEIRSARLSELAEQGDFVGDISEEIASLATFAVSALRAGIDMCSREGSDPVQLLISAGVPIIADAIGAALSDPEVRQSIIRAERVRTQEKMAATPDGLSRTLSVRPAPSNVRPVMKAAPRNHG